MNKKSFLSRLSWAFFKGMPFDVSVWFALVGAAAWTCARYYPGLTIAVTEVLVGVVYIGYAFNKTYAAYRLWEVTHIAGGKVWEKWYMEVGYREAFVRAAAFQDGDVSGLIRQAFLFDDIVIAGGYKDTHDDIAQMLRNHRVTFGLNWANNVCLANGTKGFINAYGEFFSIVENGREFFPVGQPG